MDNAHSVTQAFAEKQRPVKDNPAKQGEVPRKPDDSQDNRNDPFPSS